jgi:nicotinamide mononucleotide transporter
MSLFIFVLSAISIAAAVLNIKRRVEAFYLWVFANFGWVFVDIARGVTWQSLMFFVYAVIATWGAFVWSRKPVVATDTAA